jgi:hypothetical protein
MRSLLALALGALLLLAGGAAGAQAADCTATEIVASNEKEGIDPRLERFRAKLTRPPFSAWDTFKLLGEPRLRADLGKPVTARLATGGSLRLVFKERIKAERKVRLRFGIDIDARGGKRTVSTVVAFDDRDSVLIAGEPHGMGTYILALTCTSP